MSHFSIHAPLLRKAGFRKTYSSKSGGVRMDEWEKRSGSDRKVIVQLWGDGHHRATHSIRGCQTTHPTDFDGPDTLASAIEQETARMDNKYLPQPAAPGVSTDGQ